MEVNANILYGDCAEQLKKLPDDSVDLIVTSPPYADQRKTTYGGIAVNQYVEWFLPITKELLRVLKPTGTFILNIKEKVQNGERSTYVLELILEMRKQGWLWTEEFIWHKKNCYHDFIGIAQQIIKEGWTRPEKIAISGCSNGGLLMSALVTMRPDLWGCFPGLCGLRRDGRYRQRGSCFRLRRACAGR